MTKLASIGMVCVIGSAVAACGSSSDPDPVGAAGQDGGSISDASPEAANDGPIALDAPQESKAEAGSAADAAQDSAGDSQPEAAEPGCSDGLQNGQETGVDCGGGACPKCAPGQGC